MKKIVALCVQGLGSSLIIEMNIKSVLDELNLSSEYEVSHENINSFNSLKCDYIVVGKDLANSVNPKDSVMIVLTNIMDKSELLTKLKEVLIKK